MDKKDFAQYILDHLNNGITTNSVIDIVNRCHSILKELETEPTVIDEGWVLFANNSNFPFFKKVGQYTKNISDAFVFGDNRGLQRISDSLTHVLRVEFLSDGTKVFYHQGEQVDLDELRK